MLLLLATALATAVTTCEAIDLDGRRLAALTPGTELRYVCVSSSSAPGGPAARSTEWLLEGLVLVSESGASVAVPPRKRFLRRPFYVLPEVAPGYWRVWWEGHWDAKPDRAYRNSPPSDESYVFVERSTP
ncbi:MAG: hypothetical protein H6737_04275 [Alphaproteobacteria bacterium]|nr:hypothetical protein [Alphaproteobacteria bacterium]